MSGEHDVSADDSKHDTDQDDESTRSKGRRRDQPREPWELMVFIFATNLLMGANFYFFPIMYNELLHHFQVPTSLLGWPTSIHQAACMYFGILLTAPIKMWGCRVVAMMGGVTMAIGLSLSFLADSIVILSLAYGLLGGIGLSMINLTTNVTVQQHFNKNRPLANGIAMCAISIGNMVGPLWASYLLQTYGWRGSFLLHGGFMLQATVLTMQYRRAPEYRQTSDKKGCGLILADTADFSLLRNPCFLLFCLACFLRSFNNTLFNGILPNCIIFYGGTMEQAALVVTFLSICFFGSRLGCSFLANLACVNRTALLGTATALGGVTGMLLPLTFDHYTWAVVVACIHGVSIGCTNLVGTIVTVDILGAGVVARSFALAYIFRGTAMMTSTPFAGWLFDMTGNYTATFMVGGAMDLLGALLIFTILLIQKIQKKSKDPGNISKQDNEAETEIDGDEPR